MLYLLKMVIFYSYVNVYQRVYCILLNSTKGWPFSRWTASTGRRKPWNRAWHRSLCRSACCVDVWILKNQPTWLQIWGIWVFSHGSQICSRKKNLLNPTIKSTNLASNVVHRNSGELMARAKSPHNFQRSCYTSARCVFFRSGGQCGSYVAVAPKDCGWIHNVLCIFRCSSQLGGWHMTDFIPKLDLMDLPGREGKGRSHRELSLHQGGAKKTGQTAQTPNGELVMEDMEDMEVDCAPEMAVAVGRNGRRLTLRVGVVKIRTIRGFEWWGPGLKNWLPFKKTRWCTKKNNPPMYGFGPFKIPPGLRSTVFAGLPGQAANCLHQFSCLLSRTWTWGAGTLLIGRVPGFFMVWWNKYWEQRL